MSQFGGLSKYIDNQAYQPYEITYKKGDNIGKTIQRYHLKDGYKNVCNPKRPGSSYVMYSSQNRAQVKKELGSNANFADVSRELARRWAKLKQSGQTGDYIEDSSEAYTDYYQTLEAKKLVNPAFERCHAEKKNKRGVNAYTIFVKERYPSYRGKFEPTEIIKKIAAEWRALKDEGKALYKIQAEQQYQQAEQQHQQAEQQHQQAEYIDQSIQAVQQSEQRVQEAEQRVQQAIEEQSPDLARQIREFDKEVRRHEIDVEYMINDSQKTIPEMQNMILVFKSEGLKGESQQKKITDYEEMLADYIVQVDDLKAELEKYKIKQAELRQQYRDVFGRQYQQSRQNREISSS
jgi:chromosome segregation ATPase